MVVILRLLEDAVFVARLGYFYRRSSKDIYHAGFNPSEIPKKDRAIYAWNRAQYK